MGTHLWASLVAQMVKNPPAMRKTWVRSLGWEDPLEEGMQPTPVFWPGESQQGGKESDTIERLSTAHGLRLTCLGESETSGLAGVEGGSPGGGRWQEKQDEGWSTGRPLMPSTCCSRSGILGVKLCCESSP